MHANLNHNYHYASNNAVFFIKNETEAKSLFDRAQCSIKINETEQVWSWRLQRASVGTSLPWCLYKLAVDWLTGQPINRATLWRF